MKLSKLRKKTKSQLKEELASERKELMEVMFDVRVGKEKDYDQVKLCKKKVARLLTVLNEIEKEEKVRGVESKDDKETVKDGNKVIGKKTKGRIESKKKRKDVSESENKKVKSKIKKYAKDQKLKG